LPHIPRRAACPRTEVRDQGSDRGAVRVIVDYGDDYGDRLQCDYGGCDYGDSDYGDYGDRITVTDYGDSAFNSHVPFMSWCATCLVWPRVVILDIPHHGVVTRRGNGRAFLERLESRKGRVSEDRGQGSSGSRPGIGLGPGPGPGPNPVAPPAGLARGTAPRN